MQKVTKSGLDYRKDAEHMIDVINSCKTLAQLLCAEQWARKYLRRENPTIATALTVINALLAKGELLKS